jgi:peptide/nickel transport system substrate-binding protein
MSGRGRSGPWQALLVPLLIGVACAPPAVQNGSRSLSPQQPGGQRGSVTVAVAWEPDQLGAKGTGGESGSETRWIFNSPLTYYDRQGNAHAMLAERIPTRDNGDWIVNADGTMVTTYRLRPTVRWHDGVPLTAQDFSFAHQVYVDPELPFRSEVERRMSAVEAGDDHTLRITWSEPYAYANLIGIQDLPPLPRHRLEEKYRGDKGSFFTLEDWTTAYVGSGPYRLER